MCVFVFVYFGGLQCVCACVFVSLGGLQCVHGVCACVGPLEIRAFLAVDCVRGEGQECTMFYTTTAQHTLDLLGNEKVERPGAGKIERSVA